MKETPVKQAEIRTETALYEMGDLHAMGALITIMPWMRCPLGLIPDISFFHGFSNKPNNRLVGL